MSRDGGLPRLDVLERQLALALGPVVVRERLANPTASRHPSEIVTCDKDGAELRVLCKHAARSRREIHGLPSGIEYEAAVYRVTRDAGLLLQPACHGMTVDPETGARVLVLEYLDGCDRVHKSIDRKALVRAARWIGAFHAACESRRPPAGLNTYDTSYFSGWAERASSAAAGESGPESVCAWFAETATSILALAPSTLVHGEYYPENVLYRDGSVFPVDWEWAALGPGEIDLAALTEGWWPETTIAASVEAYCEGRWPHGAPAGFPSRLDAARAYLHLRWLGGGRNREGTAEATERWAEVERIAGAAGESPPRRTGQWRRNG